MSINGLLEPNTYNLYGNSMTLNSLQANPGISNTLWINLDDDNTLYLGALPIGATGGSGPTGPTGPSGGPVGPTGPSGPSGPSGPTGIGITGPSGPSGPSGPTGLTGISGLTGPTGPSGTSGPSPLTSFELYVSLGGSDSSGNGSAINQYRTINHALGLLQSVVSSSTPGVIHIGAGIWSENITIVPYISFNGLGNGILSEQSVSSVLLTGNFSGNNGAFNTSGANFISFNNLTFNSGTVSFDFSILSAPYANIVFSNCTLATSTFTGKGTNNVNFQFNQCNVVTSGVLTLNNLVGVLNSCNINQLTVNGSSGTVFVTDYGSVYQIINATESNSANCDINFYGSSIIQSIATAGPVSIVANSNTLPNNSSNITFSAGTSVDYLDVNNTIVGFTDTHNNFNIAIGSSYGQAASFGGSNTLIDAEPISGVITSGALNNVCVGNASTSGLSSGYQNVLVGVNTGVTSGNNNVSVGYNAGANMSSGSGNAIVGNQAATTVGTSQNNTCIGCFAGSGSTFISPVGGSTFIGFAAGSSSTSPLNTYMGVQACFDEAAGSSKGHNIGIGAGTTVGASNNGAVAIGYVANASGATGIAIGYGAQSTGNASICLGASSVASGLGDIVVGYQAVVGGQNNVVLGNGMSGIAGIENVMIGYQSGTGITGNANVVIGANSGLFITGANYNICIGNQAGPSGNYANTLNLGNEAAATGPSGIAIASSAFPMTLASTASGGASGALPADAAGYLPMLLNGKYVKFPFFLP